jgi:hypothetical protein
MTTQRLLSVGIRLHLHDPPNTSFAANTTLRRNRSGKVYLRFGTRGRADNRFEQPRLLWTNGHGLSHALDLLDVSSIRPPAPFELDESYPLANPLHSFFVMTHAPAFDRSDGTASSLLFEAMDEVQMVRVTAALRGIIGKLARQIVLGESEWMVQMMAASSSQLPGGGGEDGQSGDTDESGDLCAMADVTDHLVNRTDHVKRTGLMRQAQGRLRKGRCRTDHEKRTDHVRRTGLMKQAQERLRKGRSTRQVMQTM